MISSLSSDSLGEYSCLAKNTQGSASVLLNVLDGREIIVTRPPKDEERPPGKTVREAFKLEKIIMNSIPYLDKLLKIFFAFLDEGLDHF